MNLNLSALAWLLSVLLFGTAACATNSGIRPPLDPNTPDMKQTHKVTPFLMFNDQLEAALELYTATFPDSRVENMARMGQDGPVSSAKFVIGGQRFMGFNGGPHFKFTEGFSMFVDCQDQAEVDRYWDKLIQAGSKPTQCGWINDPYGISWQIIPRRFMELMRGDNPKKVKAVVDAMMKMQKLDVEVLERAYAEG